MKPCFQYFSPSQKTSLLKNHLQSWKKCLAQRLFYVVKLVGKFVSCNAFSESLANIRWGPFICQRTLLIKTYLPTYILCISSLQWVILTKIFHCFSNVSHNIFRNCFPRLYRLDDYMLYDC